MNPPTDATTTPPAARIPVLIGLAAVAAYLLLGVHSAFGILSGAGAPASDPYWLGRWKMFTDLRPHHTALQASVRRGGTWQAVDLAAVLPNHWQEGPGYDRRAFWDHPERLEALATHTCQHTRGEAISLTVHRWEKTLGAMEQPAHAPEERRLLERPCAVSP